MKKEYTPSGKWQKQSVVAQGGGNFLVPPSGHSVTIKLVKNDRKICKIIYTIICAMQAFKKTNINSYCTGSLAEICHYILAALTKQPQEQPVNGKTLECNLNQQSGICHDLMDLTNLLHLFCWNCFWKSISKLTKKMSLRINQQLCMCQRKIHCILCLYYHPSRTFSSCNGWRLWFLPSTNLPMTIWEMWSASPNGASEANLPQAPPAPSLCTWGCHFHSLSQGTSGLHKKFSGLWDCSNGIAVHTDTYA